MSAPSASDLREWGQSFIEMAAANLAFSAMVTRGGSAFFIVAVACSLWGAELIRRGTEPSPPHARAGGREG